MKQTGQLIQFLTRLITGRADTSTDGLKQHQREALIDAMLYCLFADDYDDPVERNVMDKAVGRLNWESSFSVAEYVQSASQRINAAVSSKETEQELLKDISVRLENWETRFRVIQLCKILFYSDLFFSDEEVRALAELSRAFKKH